MKFDRFNLNKGRIIDFYTTRIPKKQQSPTTNEFKNRTQCTYGARDGAGAARGAGRDGERELLRPMVNYFN